MSQELLLTDWEIKQGTGTMVKNSDGISLTSTSNFWIHTPFIEFPQSGTFEYDFICSITANDQVYIQIERYDINKGSISNNAAVNCIGGVKPTTDVIKQRYNGIIDIATFNSGTKTAYIRVRICNGYNSTSGTFIIHNWSLRNITGTNQTASIKKNGQILGDHMRENYPNAAFDKAGFINAANSFYEY